MAKNEHNNIQFNINVCNQIEEKNPKKSDIKTLIIHEVHEEFFFKEVQTGLWYCIWWKMEKIMQ